MNIEDLFGISGKVALVTGGAKGLGYMIASGLVAAGATVYLAGRDRRALEAVADRIGTERCYSIAGDLLKEQFIDDLVDQIDKRGTGLDILVNNAGATWGAPFETHPPERFSRVLSLNLEVPFRLTQRAMPLLLRNATHECPARIINIASVDGMEPPQWESYGYSSSKAAMIMLTRHLAGRLASDNITVNAISPGLFRSPMTEFLFKSSAAEDISAPIPLGRAGTTEDIVGAVIYLASRAGAWVTGVNLPVTGGVATARLSE